MPGPDCFPLLDVSRSLSSVLAAPAGLLGYIGLGPEQEFIPYFLALLAWAGAALAAVLQWPLAMLLRRFARAKGDRQGELDRTSVAELQHEGSPHQS